MTRDPQTLRAHPAIKAMPRWPKASEEWRAFVEDIRDHGLRHPVLVTKDGLVIDGWTRVMAARDLQLAAVPVEEVAGTEAFQIIMREMCLRRNLTKGQRAYLAWPMFKPLAAELEARHIEGLKSGKIATLPTLSNSVGQGAYDKAEDALGAQIGVSGELLRQARTLHEVFSGERRKFATYTLKTPPEELRAFWEPRILDLEKPMGLGLVLKGMSGKDATEGGEKGVSPVTQLEFFEDGLAALKTVFAPDRWAKTDGQFRQRIVTDFRLAAAAWPADVRRQIAQALLDEEEVVA